MKLFFRREGKGPAMVILHGLYGSSDNWIGIARKLAEKYTVYCVDLRNHGRSPHHPDHSYKAMKADVAEFFEDHKIETAVLLGHSMGGKLAMDFAADYPERIGKLIVVDIAPKNYLQEDESQFYLHRNIFMAMLETDISRFKTRGQVEDRLAEKIGDPRIIQFLVKNIVTDHETHQFRWRLNVEALYDNLEEIVEGVNSDRFSDRLPIVAYPVTFIRGLLSPYIKDVDIPTIRKIYPDATIVDIPGAGHWLHAEQPELFLSAVMKCC